MADINVTSIQLKVAGGSGTYTYEVKPNESTINAKVTPTGILSVDASDSGPGNYTVSVQISDGVSTVITTIPVSVEDQNALVVKTVNIPIYAQVLPQTVTETLTVGGGQGPYVWELVSSPLPGATLTPTGVLTLPVSSFGAFPVSVRVTDASKRSAAKSIAVQVFTKDIYRLLDGKVEVSVDGTTPLDPQILRFKPTIKDSRDASTTKDFFFKVLPIQTPLRVKSPSAPILYSTDQGKIPVSLSGSSDITIPTQTQGAVLGMSVGFDPAKQAITLTAPPTSFGTSRYNVSLGMEKGGSTVGSLRRDLGVTAIKSPQDWGSCVVDLPFMFVDHPQAFNPLKPYPNSPNWTKGERTVRVKSGSALPPGMNLDSNTGVVYGTPTQIYSTPTVLEYLNGLTPVGEVSLTWHLLKNDFLCGLNFPSELRTGQDVSVDFTPAPGNVIDTITHMAPEFSGNRMCAGLNIVQEGDTWKIKGTPKEAGEMSFWLKVTSKAGGNSYICVPDTGRRLYSSFQTPLVITTSSLPTVRTGAPYTATLSAYGGSGQPYTWSLVGSTLPAGLTLSPDGVISGTTATTSYDQNIQVKVVDISKVTSQTATLRLKIMNDVVIDTQTLPVVKSDTPYRAEMKASGGNGKYTWSVTGLPQGFVLDPAAGVITHPNPSTIGSALDTKITATVTDGVLVSQPRQFRLWLNNGFTNLALVQVDGGSVVSSGCAYKATFKINSSNPIAPFAWTLKSAPKGLTLSSTPQSSVVSVVGSAKASDVTSAPTLTLEVVDGAGSTGKIDISLSSTPSLKLTPNPTLPSAVVGRSYSVDLSQYGYTCVPPLSWSMTGTPVGLTLNPTTGVLSGTAQSPAVNNLVITVTDGDSASAYTSTTLRVTTDALNVLTTSLPKAGFSVPYTVRLAVKGGLGPYTWSLAPNSGMLPPGLSLNQSTGDISGTPSSYFNPVNLIFRVDDSQGNTATSGVLLLEMVSNLRIKALTSAVLGNLPYLGVVFDKASLVGHDSYRIEVSGIPPGTTYPDTLKVNTHPTLDGLFQFKKVYVNPQNGAGVYALSPVGNLNRGVLPQSSSGHILGVNVTIGGQSAGESFTITSGLSVTPSPLTDMSGNTI